MLHLIVIFKWSFLAYFNDVFFFKFQPIFLALRVDDSGRPPQSVYYIMVRFLYAVNFIVSNIDIEEKWPVNN